MAKLIPRIEQALTIHKKPIPETLKLLKLETDTSKHETIALSMYCFWTGEMRLGAIEGVIATEAGWYDGREVTLVTYHKDLIDLKKLVRKAAQFKCANKVYVKSAHGRKLAASSSKLIVETLDLKGYRTAKASDQKRQLSGTKYSKLILTPSQSTKVNAYVRTSPEKAKRYLTRKQVKLIK